jgi:hypothetical protein
LKHTALRHMMDEVMRSLEPRASVIRITGGLPPEPDPASEAPSEPPADRAPETKA